MPKTMARKIDFEVAELLLRSIKDFELTDDNCAVLREELESLRASLWLLIDQHALLAGLDESETLKYKRATSLLDEAKALRESMEAYVDQARLQQNDARGTGRRSALLEPPAKAPL